MRLAALKDAPFAFGSKWEHEKERAEEGWRNAVVSRTRFVAEADGDAIGMAAIGPSTYTGAAAITSVWVSPEARGKGVGDSLVRALFAWARERGYTQLLLWVADGNTHAEALYKRHGFRRTGDVQQVRADEDRMEFEMSVRF